MDAGWHSTFVGLRNDKDARKIVWEIKGLATAPKHYRGWALVSNEWRYKSLSRQTIKLIHKNTFSEWPACRVAQHPGRCLFISDSRGQEG
jgi:hypothetical protein